MDNIFPQDENDNEKINNAYLEQKKNEMKDLIKTYIKNNCVEFKKEIMKDSFDEEIEELIVSIKKLAEKEKEYIFVNDNNFSKGSENPNLGNKSSVSDNNSLIIKYNS